MSINFSYFKSFFIKSVILREETRMFLFSVETSDGFEGEIDSLLH
jgi:hypothetical protein